MRPEHDDLKRELIRRTSAKLELQRGLPIVLPRAVRIKNGSVEYRTRGPYLPNTEALLESEKAPFPKGLLGETRPGVLWRFMKLAYDPSDQNICTFARGNGVLGIDGEGRFSSNVEAYFEDVALSDYPTPPSDEISEYRTHGTLYWWREPLAHWKRWAEVVRLMFLFGVELSKSEALLDVDYWLYKWEIKKPDFNPDVDNWIYNDPWWLLNSLREPGMSGLHPKRDDGKNYDPQNEKANRLAAQRTELGYWLDTILTGNYLKPRVNWLEGNRPVARISHHTDPDQLWAIPHRVFGDVLTELLAVLQTGRGFHLCDECGRPYDAQRRKGYCPTCRSERKRSTGRQSWAKANQKS